jgi:hypothetical protein
MRLPCLPQTISGQYAGISGKKIMVTNPIVKMNVQWFGVAVLVAAVLTGCASSPPTNPGLAFSGNRGFCSTPARGSA